MPLNASKESFFGVVCTFGQLKPLEALLQLTDLMPLIYKCLLQYIGKPSYLDLCDRDIDYELFGTSKTQKMQVKRRMARLLQDALDYCSNQTEFEWMDLAQQWRKNPIYYYSSEDMEKKNGQKISIRDASVVQQEHISAYSSDDWFAGECVL